MKAILIVDRDLGFVFWLGQVLDAAGYVAVPAEEIAVAAKTAASLTLPVAILIASPAQPGYSEFEESLRFKFPDLQVIALAHVENPAWATPRSGTVWKCKPRRLDEASSSEWSRLIHELDCACLAPISPQ